MSYKLRTWFKVSSLLLTVILGAANALPAFAQEVHRFDIAASEAPAAIQEFGVQSGVQILAAADGLRGKRLNAVAGDLSTEQGLQTLLAGSGLTHRYVDDHAVALMAQTPVAGNSTEIVAGGKAPAAESKRSFWDRFRVAQLDQAEPATSLSHDATKNLYIEQIDEIVVTGTHLRGQAPVGANLIVIDQAAIARSGRVTVQDVVQTLPQNFMGGGANEGTRIGGGPTNVNASNGSSINLRGLGPGATVVLLNGRRIAPAGGDASFVDVASLPASAIDRIEVLLDGASAIYGADAVAGVVNIIVKRDYDGVETRLHGGIPTQGEASEYSIGQTVGGHWETGHAMLVYDYYQRDALNAREREVTASQDLRPLGGSDFRGLQGNPGTIVIGTRTWAIPRGQDGSSLTPSSFTGAEGTRNLFDANELRQMLPKQQRHSVFGSVTQALGERLELSADGFASQRDSQSLNTGSSTRISVPRTNAYYVNPTGGTGNVGVDYNFSKDLGPVITDVDVTTYYGSLGATMPLAGSWKLLVRGDHSRESVDQLNSNRPITAALNTALADSNRATAFNPFGDGSFTNPATLALIRGTTSFESDSRMNTGTVSTTGSLFALPAGEVSVALGGEYRYQMFASAVQASPGVNSFVRSDADRDVGAAFVEFRVPLIGQANAVPAVRRLELSLATRYEHYSDFGSATSPALALEWSPLPGLSVRVSGTESFKAPNLPSLDESGNTTLIVPVPDPQSGTGSTRALIWTGNGNEDLDAEQAKSWSAGLDWAPLMWPGVKLGLTYFDIDFKDRIQSLALLSTSLLQDPRFADAVIRTPTREQRVEACSRARFSGVVASDCTDAPVGALLDARPRNAASTREQGIDLAASFNFDVPVGSVQLALNATHLLKLEEALTDLAPRVELVNTPFQPVDLRLRGTLGWSFGPWGVGSAVTYIDGYRDTLSTPHRSVSAWTGVDLYARYQNVMASGWLDGFSMGLYIANVTDEQPSFVNNSAGIGYDPTNSDPMALIGRTIRLQVSKSWGQSK